VTAPVGQVGAWAQLRGVFGKMGVAMLIGPAGSKWGTHAAWGHLGALLVSLRLPPPRSSTGLKMFTFPQ